MGVGRQVADAYIEVHGDLSKFRDDLNKANGSMEDWAKNNADDLSEAWGDRMRSQMDRQWGSVIDAMHSGKKVDFNRMIEAFDFEDMDAAFVKIDDMLQSLQKNGKLTEDRAREMSAQISRQIGLIQKQQRLENNLAEDREKWDNAHKIMMGELHAARRRQNEEQKKMYWEAYDLNMRFDSARKKMLNEAFAENARYDAARRKMISEAIRDNEAWARSFTGVMHAASKMDLDKRFKELGEAMATNDWSKLSRGAKDMQEMSTHTLETAQRMHDLGRMSDEQLQMVQTRLADVRRNMDRYNVSFTQANRESTKHRRDWVIIQRAVTNAGKKFAGFSGLNVLTDIFRDGAQFFQDLDRNAVKIGKMTLLVGGLGAVITQMLGGIAVVGQDLAKLAQIGILAPGFLTGAAIQIGVLVAALKDIGTVLADLKPAFAGLQDAISSNFWDVAAQPIRDMVNTLLPTLQAKLGETATAMGGMAATLANSLGNLDQGQIGTMFDRMNAGITIATAAIDPLVQAFQTMGMVGSEYFERFGTWIVDLSTRFNDFIQSAAADGRLNLWIEEAIQAFKDVWSILGSVVGIFNAVANAAEAAGIGGLSVMAEAMRRISDVMNGSAFQETLTLAFEGAAAAARTIGTAIYDLGPAIQSFMPTLSAGLGTIGETVSTVIGYLGQIMSNPLFQQGLTAFLQGVQAGVEALGPAIGPLGNSLGQIGELLGQVAGIVGTLVGALVTNLSPVLDTITEAFGRITFAAGPEIVSIIETLGTVLGGVVEALLPPLENLIMTVLPLIAPLFAAVVPVIDALITVLAPLLEGIGQLVAMIAPYLVPAFEAISSALAPVIEVIGVLVNAVMTVLVPILGFLLIGVINNIVGVFEGFGNVVMGVVNIIVSVFEGFRDIFIKIFEGDFGGALQAAGDMFKGIWDGIMQVLGGALEFLWNAVQLIFIGKLVKGITSALTGIGAFFKTSWDDIGRLVSGAIDDVYRFITGGLGNARSFIDDALKTIVNFFKNGFSNAASAVSSGVGNIMGWIRGIPGNISSALGNLGNLLKNAGRAIIDGLLNGLKAAWGGVTSFVGGIASWIRDNKGPLPYDRALLIPAGNAIMEGLGKGLEDKLGMLKGVLETVTDTMTDTVTEAFAKNKMYLAGADAALGLADGLRSNKNAVVNALSAVMPDASASVSASYVRKGSGAEGGRDSDPRAGGGTVIESGAIVISTPTKDPEIVAEKVIDNFANFSNL